MQISRDPLMTVTVRHIERGRLRIGNAHFERTIAITADEIFEDWTSPEVAELKIAHLEPLLAKQPEIVVIGTGWSPTLPPRELTFAMARRGIGFEVMDTPAACRTFNILVAEGRKPAAVLILD